MRNWKFNEKATTTRGEIRTHTYIAIDRLLHVMLGFCEFNMLWKISFHYTKMLSVTRSGKCIHLHLSAVRRVGNEKWKGE